MTIDNLMIGRAIGIEILNRAIRHIALSDNLAAVRILVNARERILNG